MAFKVYNINCVFFFMVFQVLNLNKKLESIVPTKHEKCKVGTYSYK